MIVSADLSHRLAEFGNTLDFADRQELIAAMLDVQSSEPDNGVAQMVEDFPERARRAIENLVEFNELQDRFGDLTYTASAKK